MRTLRRVLLPILLAVGVMFALTPSAQARLVQHGLVGTIQGFYRNASAGGPAYYGTKFRANPGDCVDVQRKSVSADEWTVAGVYNYRSCTGVPSDWAIRNPDFVSNTKGIRLFNIGTHSFVVLCSSKADCLAM